MIKTKAERRMLSSAQVRGLFGGRSDRTLRRWLADKDFPKPQKIFGRNFYDEDAVYAWRDRQIGAA